MLGRISLLGLLVLPLGAETYHAACVAFDSVNKAVYISDPFEQECAAEATCRREVAEKWSAFLKKEGLAQTAGAILRCELYRDGSQPNESPRSRVRKWRDEHVAQTQADNKGKYTKVVQTTFEFK